MKRVGWITLGPAALAAGATCVALSLYAFFGLTRYYTIRFSDSWIPWLVPAIGLVGIGLIAGGVYMLRYNHFELRHRPAPTGMDS